MDYSLQQKDETFELNLISALKRLALMNSQLKGRVLRINNWVEYVSILDLVDTITPSNVSLDNIFLPVQKKEFINIFINTLQNYKEGNLRYLFNGQPGTAKTQIIHSIMNSVGSIATFVILENRNIPLNDVFNLCSIFDPCVLVIDDLDLLIEERNRANSKNELSVFLSNLDGFNYKNLFILATTNDKKFVDLAAQRPGRFNLIIDVDEIASENYLNLIKRETNDEEIIMLFGESRLNELASRRITGAFIVNLIKLLKMYKEQNGSISEEKLLEILNFSFNGFYKSNNKEKEIGFY
jgi:SpoVK/Ycf46/Vps4 family AAA+-type ATPase